MDAERNFPGAHFGLHAVAFAIADEFLAERFDFGNFVTLYDNGKLILAGPCQKALLLPALALEEGGEVRYHAVGHFVAELACDRLEVVHLHDENEQAFARILVLGDVLEVFYQADPVVDAGQRVGGDSVFQQSDVNLQERQCENGIRERNIRDKVLDDAGEARDKGDEGEVKGFFSVRGVALLDGVLDADDHCREDVDEIDPDKERQ